ncbi:MAG: hypothetical protein QM640_17030 [Niabella sp.]
MQFFQQSPPAPLNDYRLILDLPPAVKKKITAVKAILDDDYRAAMLTGNHSFIYLATFIQTEMNEYKMAEVLNKIALGFMPFKVHLNGFDHIEKEEIFIKIKEANAIQKLINEIKIAGEYLQAARYNEIPRISVVQRLQPLQFEKSWKLVSQKHFSATFVAGKMLLLKRMVGFKSWQILRRMSFENLLVD